MTITLTREEAQQVLDALEDFCEYGTILKPIEKRDFLRSRLAQPEPEPVAWMDRRHETFTSAYAMNHHMADPLGDYVPLYTAPPQREWQGLTDEEANALTYASIAEIEAKLKEKNT